MAVYQRTKLGNLLLGSQETLSFLSKERPATFSLTLAVILEQSGYRRVFKSLRFFFQFPVSIQMRTALRLRGAERRVKL